MACECEQVDNYLKEEFLKALPDYKNSTLADVINFYKELVDKTGGTNPTTSFNIHLHYKINREVNRMLTFHNRHTEEEMKELKSK